MPKFWRRQPDVAPLRCPPERTNEPGDDKDQRWIATFAASGNPGAQISLMKSDATASVQPDASTEVDDVDAAHTTAQRLGCEIVHPLTDEPWGVRRFFVRARNGKVLNVLSQRQG